MHVADDYRQESEGGGQEIVTAAGTARIWRTNIPMERQGSGDGEPVADASGTSVLPAKPLPACAGFECMAAADMLRAGELQLQPVLTMFLANPKLKGLAKKIRTIIRAVQREIRTPTRMEG